MKREPNWSHEARIFPIQIRADLTVRVQDIPYDLTKAEAEKIAAVVLAMVAPD